MVTRFPYQLESLPVGIDPRDLCDKNGFDMMSNNKDRGICLCFLGNFYDVLVMLFHTVWKDNANFWIQYINLPLCRLFSS